MVDVLPDIEGAQNTAPEVHSIAPGEVRNISVSCAGRLDAGETLTGTPTVTSDQALTINNKRVSSGALFISGQFVAAGQAVLFQVTDSLDDTIYTLSISCGTSAGQTVKGRIVLVGEIE